MLSEFDIYVWPDAIEYLTDVSKKKPCVMAGSYRSGESKIKMNITNNFILNRILKDATELILFEIKFNKQCSSLIVYFHTIESKIKYLSI